MLVNASTLQMIFINLKTTFNKAFSAAPSMWDKVATLVPSTGSENDYAWLQNFPRMRKWVGDKMIKSLAAHKYTLVNDDYEATVAVKRNHIKDDQLGIYAPQAQDAGFSAKQWPDELVFEVLNKSFTEKCYDGLPFFSDKHMIGKAQYSNTGKKALDASSVAKAKASYGAARTQLSKIKDEDGRPLNIRPTLLVVPPALEDEANTLMTAERLDDGKANIYKGTATVLVVPWLTSDTAWFLMDVSRPLKPLIFQQREAPVFVSQTDMNNPDVFNRGEYKFGAEARGAAGFGFWQMAFGSTGEEA
ncbi:Mu-like prophage major head subunit gpT family protein [Enterobacter asburiae]|uniref:Mu-like prophage major head subunit gpT family protein n=1 Tax=Enterobacter asburiae TaxID=61645 RepID=UPI003F55773A